MKHEKGEAHGKVHVLKRTANPLVIDAVARSFLRAIGCIGGNMGVGFECLFSALVNRGHRQPLSDRAKRVMAEFFPQLNLNDVELRTDATLAIAAKYRGITLGKTIYLRGGFNDGSPNDMQLLMHELVHVDQFRRLGRMTFACEYGMGVLLTWDHDEIPLEKEAIAFKRANEGRLNEAVAAA